MYLCSDSCWTVSFVASSHSLGTRVRNIYPVAALSRFLWSSLPRFQNLSEVLPSVWSYDDLYTISFSIMCRIISISCFTWTLPPFSPTYLSPFHPTLFPTSSLPPSIINGGRSGVLSKHVKPFLTGRFSFVGTRFYVSNLSFQTPSKVGIKQRTDLRKYDVCWTDWYVSSGSFLPGRLIETTSSSVRK